MHIRTACSPLPLPTVSAHSRQPAANPLVLTPDLARRYTAGSRSSPEQTDATQRRHLITHIVAEGGGDT